MIEMFEARAFGSLPKIFDEIYESAFDRDRWVPTLTAAARTLDVAGVSIIGRPSLKIPTINPPVLDEMASDYFDSGWFQQNDRLVSCIKFWAAGGGAGASRLVSNEILNVDDPLMRTLPIQEEFFRRHRLRWFIGAEMKICGGEPVYLSVDRFETAERFTSDELAAVDLLAQHIRQALRIIATIEAAAAQGAGMSFDSIGRAAVMVGRNAKVLALNRRAEAHLGKSIRVVDGALCASDPGAQRAFAALVTQAADQNFTSSRSMPDPVALGRRGRRPLLAHAIPCRAASNDLFRGVSAIVLLVDPDEGLAPIAVKALEDVFELTPAEARLAAAIHRGCALEACAVEFGVTVRTVRNQLTAVFRKTGVSRQSDLIALLAQLNPIVEAG